MDTNSRSVGSLLQPFLKNLPDDSAYSHYKYSRLFIKQQYNNLPKNMKETWPRDWRLWMEILGYTKPQGLLKRIPEWINLIGEIPYPFLEQLGIYPDQLQSIFNLDLDFYEETLSKATLPKSFTVRLYACVYPSYSFPPGLTELEAVQYVQEFIGPMKPSHISSVINFRNLKTICVSRTGSGTIYYRPKVTFGKLGVRYDKFMMPGTVRFG